MSSRIFSIIDAKLQYLVFFWLFKDGFRVNYIFLKFQFVLCARDSSTEVIYACFMNFITWFRNIFFNPYKKPKQIKIILTFFLFWNQLQNLRKYFLKKLLLFSLMYIYHGEILWHLLSKKNLVILAQTELIYTNFQCWKCTYPIGVIYVLFGECFFSLLFEKILSLLSDKTFSLLFWLH